MATIRKNNFTSLQSGLSVLLCILIALEGVHCRGFVQFFRDVNYSGLLKEFDVTDDNCVNVEFPGGKKAVASMKTDICLMVYDTPSCRLGENFTGLSFRVEQDEPNLSPGFSHLQNLPYVQSFQACSAKWKGGPQVDVDFIDGMDYVGKMQIFRNVCGCRNLRYTNKWGRTKQISVDNYGNSIELFSGEHCTGKSKILPAGYSSESRNLWSARDFDIRSFRSANIFNCLRMDAAMYNFNFEKDKAAGDVGLDHFTETAQLATSAKMRNNKAAKLTQEYTISQKVTNTMDITLSNALSKMHKLGFSTDFKTTAAGGIKPFFEAKLSFGVGMSYSHQWSNSTTNTTKKVITNEETVTTRQVIEVPSCKECVASSFIQKIKGYPIGYSAYTRVNISDAGRPLEAAAVKRFLPPGLNYIRDYDEYTVEAVSKGTLMANIAMDAFINVDCVSISDCKN